MIKTSNKILMLRTSGFIDNAWQNLVNLRWRCINANVRVMMHYFEFVGDVEIQSSFNYLCTTFIVISIAGNQYQSFPAGVIVEKSHHITWQNEKKTCSDTKLTIQTNQCFFFYFAILTTNKLSSVNKFYEYFMIYLHFYAVL